jgi:acetoin utilization protein AcuB
VRHATIPIREYMTPTVHTVDLETSLPDARRLMQAHGIRHLPVLDGARLVGVVSQRDVVALETSPFIDTSTVSVHDAMAEVPYAVPPETPLREVVQVMAENKYGSVVVIEGERVCGIFTTVDAMAILAEMLLRPD